MIWCSLFRIKFFGLRALIVFDGPCGAVNPEMCRVGNGEPRSTVHLPNRLSAALTAAASSQSAQLSALAFLYRRRAVTLKPLSPRQVNLACVAMWATHVVLSVSAAVITPVTVEHRLCCTKPSTSTRESS